MEKLNLEPHEAGYVGDDIHDVPAMKLVGMPISVSNARPEAKDYSVYVTSAPGGHGAVRELSEWLLALRGEKDAIFAQYIQTREEKEANHISEPDISTIPAYSISERPATR